MQLNNPSLNKNGLDDKKSINKESFQPTSNTFTGSVIT